MSELQELLQRLEAIADEKGVAIIEIEPANFTLSDGEIVENSSRYSVAHLRYPGLGEKGYGDTLEEAIQNYLERFGK